jgi:hypothetical protein
MNEFLGAMGGFLEGRAVYEDMARVWPAAHEDPDSPPLTAEFARIRVDMPKVVYSRTLERADRNTTIAREVRRTRCGACRPRRAATRWWAAPTWRTPSAGWT